MDVCFQILYFVFGILLISYGIKTFKNSEKIYLERKKHRTSYENWANEKNTSFFIKFSAIAIIFFEQFQ